MTLGREAARGGHVAAMWRQCRNLFGRRAGDHGIVGVCELAIAQTLFKVGGFPTDAAQELSPVAELTVLTPPAPATV